MTSEIFSASEKLDSKFAFEPDEKIVSMIEFQGHVFVATSFRVFRTNDAGELVQLMAVSQPEGMLVAS